MANNEPVVKVSGGGGFFIQGSVGELNRNEIEIGQTVQVMSYNTGESFEGTITAVGDYPLTGTWYSGDGNPTVSYYPFTVTIDESANLEAGTYTQITYSFCKCRRGRLLFGLRFYPDRGGQKLRLCAE